MKNSSKINIDVKQKPVLEITTLILNKVLHIQHIINNTLLSINRHNKHEIFSNSDVIICTNTLVCLYENTKSLVAKLTKYENIHVVSPTMAMLTEINEVIDGLQAVIDKLSIVICGYGTLNLEDIFYVSFGPEFDQQQCNLNDEWKDKYDLLIKYLRPLNYKIIYWRQNKTKPCCSFGTNTGLCSNKMIDDVVQIEMSNQFECYDADADKSLYVRLYGVRLVIHDEKTQKTLIIQGLLDDVITDCITNKYVDCRKKEMRESIILDGVTDMTIMNRILDTLTLKDYLIYGNLDIYKKYIAVMTEVNGIKHAKLDMTLKRFLESSLYIQRQVLINLLIYNKEDEMQYITYLLYDLLATKQLENGQDSEEQKIIFNSFPWKIKMYFSDAMNNTIKYTEDIKQKYDSTRVSLEQQIYLMKAPENVKEKAMIKLKDVKNKGDSESKSKQYLEGLLRIPFSIYREEPILKKVKMINQNFLSSIHSKPGILSDLFDPRQKLPSKLKYTTLEILNYCDQFHKNVDDILIDKIKEKLEGLTAKHIATLVSMINVNKTLGSQISAITAKTKGEKISEINRVLDELDQENTACKSFLIQLYDAITIENPELTGLNKLTCELDKCSGLISEIKTDMDNVTAVLDESIYGHRHAKNQIMKIIAQWMNGELGGYVFGFEGSPGIGKTSLAKNGLAKCLMDANVGTSRPFSFIGLGGATNSSFLDGHGFTYTNSTYGKIVDVLMESKCMNPIIYIDELDKVSKTEHGKEIIGVLTHLTDPTQNDVFQDKYFSGIDLDLSKALIIFSYNDVSQIDKVLLDRIHRIKFDNLSVAEKIVIVRQYLLPAINKNMGFENVVEIDDSVIELIIQEYTTEPGVRKLKEILFDLFGEINIEILQGRLVDVPVKLTRDLIVHKYLANYDKISERRIHDTREVGVVNCLWANSLGMGGIMTMKTAFAPSNTFLELKLTGMQSDLMKESMHLAVNVAWEMLDNEKQASLVKKFQETKCQAIHIHMGSFSSKDGPSASALSTISVYSLFMGIPIYNDVAFTGEIDFLGRVSEIGGLEHKIFGAKRAGIKKILYPKRNHDDFVKIVNKFGEASLDGMEFVEIENIKEAMEHLLCKM